MAINPQGTQGRDWDRESIELRNGVKVRITAINQTKTDQSGNRSRIQLFINGESKADVTNDSATASVSFDLQGDGEYEIEAIGSNERADAYRVDISVGGLKFEPQHLSLN